MLSLLQATLLVISLTSFTTPTLGVPVEEGSANGIPAGLANRWVLKSAPAKDYPAPVVVQGDEGAVARAYWGKCDRWLGNTFVWGILGKKDGEWIGALQQGTGNPNGFVDKGKWRKSEASRKEWFKNDEVDKWEDKKMVLITQAPEWSRDEKVVENQKRSLESEMPGIPVTVYSEALLTENPWYLYRDTVWMREGKVMVGDDCRHHVVPEPTTSCDVDDEAPSNKIDVLKVPSGSCQRCEDEACARLEELRKKRANQRPSGSSSGFGFNGPTLLAMGVL